MIENKASELWAHCLRIIKDNVSIQQYKTFFEIIEPLDYKEDTQSLTIKVPSHFVYEFLEGQFFDLLKSTLHKVIGPRANLMYKILTDKTNGISQNIPESDRSSISCPPVKSGPESPSKIIPSTQDLNPMLNPTYNFNNFIEGESNKLTRSVGQAVALHPAKDFNPLFIFGPSGVGKTHLVNAIGTKIKELYPNKRVLYVSAHLFQVQYTDSVRKNTTNDFINFYQTIDVLIIDDIQEFANLTKTQNTFFHIFNHLHQNNKQLIFTSDRSPAMLQGLEDRLLTRFKWGLQAELEKPNTELRKDILVSKMHRDGLRFPEDVVDYIAKNIDDSVRDLEGIVNSLMAYSMVYNHEIDLNMTERIVKRIKKTESKEITIDSIIKTVCQHYDVNEEYLQTKSRKKDIVLIRQIAMYFSKKYTSNSLERIGQAIGGRDHATVLHAYKLIKTQCELDNSFREEVAEIENAIKG